MPEAEGFLDAVDVVEGIDRRRPRAGRLHPGFGGLAEALVQDVRRATASALKLDESLAADALFDLNYGAFVVELAEDGELPEDGDMLTVTEIGTDHRGLRVRRRRRDPRSGRAAGSLGRRHRAVFPYRSTEAERAAAPKVETVSYTDALPLTYCGAIAKPRVVIPVFPGTNCEFDTAHAFERAGAVAQTLVINNLTPAAVAESTKALVEAIKNSQIVMLPGGFSGGDEPDGSAKFITAFFRAPEVTEAVRDLLQNRDGLMLGICNGFQALVKLGLVPYGDIRPMDADVPHADLQRNRPSPEPPGAHPRGVEPFALVQQVRSGRHSHRGHQPRRGPLRREPRLAAQLAANGQIATQYVDEAGSRPWTWT